ncbi:MAG: SMP-30/gluconolactonase/LRE family protein [Cyclobacteriaceae bacterium]
MKHIPLSLGLVLILLSCDTPSGNERPSKIYPTTGSIERLDPIMDELIPKDAEVEILASGFEWAEGPVWLADQNALLFSDIPVNTVFRWSEKDSITEFLKPAGFGGSIDGKKEPGSNGLILDKKGNLILCQHGERQVARMMAPLDKPDEVYEPLARDYNGMRLNSPNDITMSSEGVFYFTDPPYGLDDWNIKELDFQGVYKIDQEGKLTLQIDDLTRPNGIGLSPDERTLYVAVSDPERAAYYAYQLDEEGNVAGGELILDVTDMYSDERQGNPDGMVISKSGYLFATGPGGVLIISPEGTHLGTILTGEKTANCTFNQDESELYITADMHLMRVKLK